MRRSSDTRPAGWWYRPSPYERTTVLSWDWVIRHQLATGGMPLLRKDADTLDNLGISHVLNVADDGAGLNEHLLFSGRGMSYLRVPYSENGIPPEDAWFERGTDWGREALAVGGTLYVHCKVGSARGPSMAYAILRTLGWDDDLAYRAVVAARPYGSLAYVPDAEDWFERRVK